jgi:hypothetical protein
MFLIFSFARYVYRRFPDEPPTDRVRLLLRQSPSSGTSDSTPRGRPIWIAKSTAGAHGDYLFI